MTPQQIANVKKEIENDVDLLDGYEELGEQYLQNKIKQAVVEGHVGDEDWKGVHRSGSNQESLLM